MFCPELESNARKNPSKMLADLEGKLMKLNDGNVDIGSVKDRRDEAALSSFD